MIHAGHLAALAASAFSGTLLLVGNCLALRWRASATPVGRGYAVDAVGLQEARWCWPIEGYDLVVIDATEDPVDSLELCEHIKKSRPGQKVAILVGHRSGRLPFRLNADAILSGEPDGPELVRALNILLRESSGLAPF